MDRLSGPRRLLGDIGSLSLRRPLRVMNVCGGHERTITMSGIRTALPALLELIPGPGCPVCVCPEEDIRAAIALAVERRVTLLAFGDMLRVPVNGPRDTIRSLMQARAAGARVEAVASPQEVVRRALYSPHEEFVFFAAGFETTMAPVAAMLREGAPENLTVLLSGRRTWPAVEMLLASGDVRFDALIAPGHVATVMGTEEWGLVASRYGIPVAIAGFTAESLLSAVYAVTQQVIQGLCRLENCYPAVARSYGNRHAQRVLDEVMEVTGANWRGIGMIPDSGFALRETWRAHNARSRYQIDSGSSPGRDAMPPGCACAQVVLGRIYPNQCPLYGKGCDPTTPLGPCMVSDEGACRIWWNGGMRRAERTSKQPAPV